MFGLDLSVDLRVDSEPCPKHELARHSDIPATIASWRLVSEKTRMVILYP